MSIDSYLGVLVALLLYGVIELAGGSHRHRRVLHRKLRAASAREGSATGFIARDTVPVADSNIMVVNRLTTRPGGSAFVHSDSVETPPPAPGLGTLGAGSELQATDPRLERGAAVRTSSEQPHPATESSGRCSVAGLNPRTADHLQGDVPTAVRSGSHVEPTPRPGLRTTSLGAGLNPGSSIASRDSAGTSREAAGTALGSGDPGPKHRATTPLRPRQSFPDGGGPAQQQSPPVPPDLAVAAPQLPAMAQIGWEPHPRGEEAGATCPRLAAPAPLLHDYPHRSIT